MRGDGSSDPGHWGQRAGRNQERSRSTQCGARGTAADAGLSPQPWPPPCKRGGAVWAVGGSAPRPRDPSPAQARGGSHPRDNTGRGRSGQADNGPRSPCAPLPAFPSLGWRDAGPRRPALLWVPHVPARAGLGSAPVRSWSRGAAPAPPHPAGP